MKSIFPIKVRYCIAAFVAGFSLLVYELAAARILSPVVGGSIYVWTSIIGVIIGALTIGYFLGGWLADKRTKSKDLAWIFLAAAAGVLLNLLLNASILDILSSSGIDIRLQALLGSLILFAPTSLLIGTLSPYIIRMYTDSIEEVGRSVARLDALNSLGGIIGVFSAGFIFFGYIGSTQTLLALLCVLVITSTFFINKDAYRLQVFCILIIVLVAIIYLINKNDLNVVAQIETPTGTYQVVDITYNERPVRVLKTGPSGYQSGIYLDGDRKLVFEYTRSMADLTALHKNPKDILILGGGTFTVPEYLANKYPDSNVDTVEIDSQLENISEQYFNFERKENMRIFSEDGRVYVNSTKNKYDVVLIDVFNDLGIPFTATTTEFTSKLSKILKPNGIIIMNVIGSESKDCQPLVRSIYRSFSLQMDGEALFLNSDTTEYQNILLGFTNNNAEWLEDFAGIKLSKENSILLTDNFAPIDRLKQKCAKI